MKAIVNTFKRTNQVWFSIGIVFLTSLIFMTFPSCQKDKDISLNQESFNGTDIMFTQEFSSSSPIFFEYKFIRKTGAPFVETKTLGNPDLLSDLVLTIQNGDSKKTRVASAEIWIDGVLIFGPSDFSKNVTSFSKQISVKSSGSKLEVKLNSTPGSFLNIKIEGTIIGSAPIVTTNDVSAIGPYTATCGGIITSDGGSPVNERGICWSNSKDPTTAIKKKYEGTEDESFIINLTDLTQETTYYVRAYATNNRGTGYGNERSFKTPVPPR